ncbi:hypothetical protein TNCV_2886891 [Trichonephila clavipes]|nr:hypothetical protein TNCV_2886891 [Trichonephila clavipes]
MGISNAQLAEHFPSSGVCPVAWIQNSVQCQVHIRCPSCKNLSSVSGSSTVRIEELYPASGVCPVALRQKSVLRQGYVQWPGGRFLPNVIGMAIGQTTEAVQSSASKLLEITVTQEKVLPPGHWTFP